MKNTVAQYEKLVADLTQQKDISASQMFGKPCLKVRGKAFVAQQEDYVVFKLAGTTHAKALAFPKSVLWDPSGKGRPMKEWVAVPGHESKSFKSFAKATLDYVVSLEAQK